MNNTRGEMKLTALLIALITAFGLFFGLIGYSMDSLGSNYDTSGYDVDDIDKYNYLSDISNDLDSAKPSIEGVRVENNVFDWFAGVWNKLSSPFRVIYRSYDNLITATNDASSELNLPPVFRDYFSAAVIILVIVGIVMIKFYLGRRK